MSDLMIAGQAPEEKPQAGGAAESEGSAKATAEPKVFDEAYVKSLRAEAAASRAKLREFESAAAAREETEKAAKLAELSEVERLKVQLAETQKQARALEVAGVRSRAAARHGLPEDLLEFVTAEDEAGALAQAAKLAAKLKAGGSLPPSGGRNPANGTEQGKAADRQERFDALRQRVPSLNFRVLRG